MCTWFSQALWMLDPKSITEDMHEEFYRFTTNSFDKPRYHLHYKADAPLNIRALFYIPEYKPSEYISDLTNTTCINICMYSLHYHNQIVAELYCSSSLFAIKVPFLFLGLNYCSVWSEFQGLSKCEVSYSVIQYIAKSCLVFNCGEFEDVGNFSCGRDLVFLGGV